MTGGDITGTWRLQSFAFTDEAGVVFHPLGERPVGFVLFSADGYLTLNFMAGERSGYAGDDLFGGDESERAQAAAEVVSFAGPYAYDGIAVSVTVEYSVFPNWIGGTQVREVEISGDTLILRTEGAHLFAGARRQAEARLIRAKLQGSPFLVLIRGMCRTRTPISMPCPIRPALVAAQKLREPGGMRALPENPRDNLDGSERIVFRLSPCIKELLGDLEHDRAEQCQRDQVWNCHQRIQRIGQQPNETELQRRPD